ncbi:MAG: molybdate ABC transporter substrate-binding protein [Acidobacteriota bacterium]
MNRLVVLLLVVASTVGCSAPSSEPTERQLVIFAAASLRDVMTDISAAWVATGHVEPAYNFAGSNVLAQQLLAAPSADLYLSAHEDWMDRLETAERVRADTRTVVAGNTLVLVAHRDAPSWTLDDPATLGDLPFRHLVIGDPEAVPAGIYARHVLSAVPTEDGSTLWTRLQDRLIPTSDVRAALAQVAAEPEALGIVYGTDARSDPRARVLYTFPTELTPPIHYPAAVVSERPDDLADTFLAFLQSETVREIFVEHGFSTF